MRTSREHLERSLEQALASRAATVDADAATVRQRLADVLAIAEDDAVHLSATDGPTDPAGWAAAPDGHGRPDRATVADPSAARPRSLPTMRPSSAGPQPAGRRRVVQVLGAAAAAVALAAAAVTAAVLASSSDQPAQPAGPAARAYEALAREQRPEDTAGVVALGPDIDPASVRLLGRVGQDAYYAGLDRRGHLCWAVRGDSSETGGCVLGVTRPEAEPLSEDGAAVTAWLVSDDADTSDLRRRGLVPVAPSFWVDADAAAVPPE